MLHSVNLTQGNNTIAKVHRTITILNVSDHDPTVKNRTLFLLPAAALFLISLAACTGEERLSIEDVEDHIREILTLPTYEHVYRDIVYVGEEASFLGIESLKTVDRKTLFAIDVIVQGGIDLNEGVLLEDPGDGSITVKLPPARVLSIDADENSIHQYFSKDKRNRISFLQYYDEIDRKKIFLEEDAIARGLLVKAEENAHRLIANFLNLAGFDDVNFEVNRRLPAPESTQPEENEENNG